MVICFYFYHVYIIFTNISHGEMQGKRKINRCIQFNNGIISFVERYQYLLLFLTSYTYDIHSHISIHTGKHKVCLCPKPRMGTNDWQLISKSLPCPRKGTEAWLPTTKSTESFSVLALSRMSLRWVACVFMFLLVCCSGSRNKVCFLYHLSPNSIVSVV